MIVPDSNLLLYAYNTASRVHGDARAWWEHCLSGTEKIGLAFPVVFSFLRVGTKTTAFPNPLSLEEAHEAIAEWCNRSVTQIMQPSANHIQRVLELLQQAGSAGGNLVTDAQIAAIAMSYNATVHTADHDFLRFRGLKCHFPLDAG